MKEKDSQCMPDRMETVLYTELNSDSLTPRKSYREYWRRAMRKIKIFLMLRKFSSSASTDIQIGRPSEIQRRLDSFNSFESQEPRKFQYIIIPYSRFYMLWVISIGFYLVYLSTYGVFSYSFYQYEVDSKEAIIEACLDVVFILDIFFSFNLAYFSVHNTLVKKREKIFFHYLKTFFVFDVFSSIPFGVILRKDPSQEFSKMVMVRHIPKLVKWYKVKEGLNNLTFMRKFDYFYILYSHYIQLTKMLASVLMSMHISACLFYLSARADNFNEQTWVNRSGMLEMTIAEQYFTSLYWSVVTAFGIGYGEIHPYTKIEKIIAMLWMTISVFIISFSVNLTTDIFKELDKKFRKIEETLMVAEKVVKNTKVSTKVGLKILECVKNEVIVTKRNRAFKVLNEIDVDVRYEVAMSIYKSSLTNIKFFTTKSRIFIANFVFMLEFVQYKGREYIWHKKASADGIYFILSGRIKYLYNSLLFYVMREGEFFGDTELFMEVERKFDVVACELTKCLKMTKDCMRYMQEHYPQYYSELKKMRKRRRKNLMDNLTQMIVLNRYYANEIPCISRVYLKEVKKEIRSVLFEGDQKKLIKSRISAAFKSSRLTQTSINNVKFLIKSAKKDKLIE